MAKRNRIIQTDCRVFSLKWDGGMLSPFVKKDITQLDLLKIINALDRVNNKTLSEQMRSFISVVDRKESEEKGEEVKTDFKRKPPRRLNAFMLR